MCVLFYFIFWSFFNHLQLLFLMRDSSSSIHSLILLFATLTSCTLASGPFVLLLLTVALVLPVFLLILSLLLFSFPTTIHPRLLSFLLLENLYLLAALFATATLYVFLILAPFNKTRAWLLIHVDVLFTSALLTVLKSIVMKRIFFFLNLNKQFHKVRIWFY